MEQQQLRVLDTVHLSPAPAPAQDVPLLLSGLDADRNVLDFTFRTLRFLPPHPTSLNPLAVLPRAFAAALGFFPTLAGSLRDDGRVVCSGTDTVPLVLAVSSLSVTDVDTDRPDSALLDRLAPGDGDGDGAGSPALALQATRFTCGGVALGMRVAHALCDGAGATKFLAAAARFARGQEPEVAPVWERQDRLGSRRPPRAMTPFDPVLALDDDVARRGPYGAVSDRQEQLARECFHVSDAHVEALRAQLADEAGLKLTTFEVLAAFIWRAR